MAKGFVYRCFGLTWQIERPIRTFDLAMIDAETSPVDITISFASLPHFQPEHVVDDLEMAVLEDGLHIYVEDVGRFLVREGREIFVDPQDGTSDAEVDLYLAGSVMGALLHQRGILPLHCNAFEIDGSAVLVCGDSGAGKSTLACALEARGYALITDDVCAVTFDDTGRAFGHPGLPRLRLWQDAREALGRGDHSGLPIPWTEGKLEMSMSGARATTPLEIAAIYHLQEADEGESTEIARLNTLEAIDVISSSIYRRRIADIQGRTQGYLSASVTLAKDIRVHAFVREWGFDKFAQQIDTLLAHVEGLNKLAASTEA